ncbi:MAG: peptidoglycan DD-metalloendopeptidase family protein [Noviherbaspirillum sp.]
MKKTRLALMIILAASVAACSTTRTVAPVVERAGTPRSAAPKPRPVESPSGPGFYTVKKGDTLNRIAQEFNQNFRDIVIWNNLTSPDDIKVDQVLRVAPPDAAGAPAPGSAQTGSIATSSGVEVRPLGAPAAAAAAIAPSAASGGNKTWPRGDKRPYTDNALAELSRPDSAPPARSGDKAMDRPADKAAEKPVDKPSDNGRAAEDGLAWMWPAEGRVIGTFDGGRKGIDIAGKMGQPVLAAGAGTVLYASSVRGYGNLVIVKHSSNLLSAYAHNKAILVKEGQAVTKGQRIAEMGNSDTDSVKLHFEIRQQGKPVDPSKFLPPR